MGWREAQEWDVPPQRVLDSSGYPPPIGGVDESIVVPTTNCEQRRLAFKFQTVDVQEARSRVYSIVVTVELAIEYEVLRHIKQGQDFSEPSANLRITTFNAARRTVINTRIVGKDGIEQLPIETVDSCGVAGKEIIHANPIRHGEVTHIHEGEATSVSFGGHVSRHWPSDRTQ